MLVRSLSASLIALVLLASCAVAAPAASDAPTVAAVIVKPDRVSEPAAVVAAVERVLGADAGVRYVRPLAGDAHIVHLTAPARREQVPSLIERLRTSKAFQYVELDSMMKIQ